MAERQREPQSRYGHFGQENKYLAAARKRNMIRGLFCKDRVQATPTKLFKLPIRLLTLRRLMSYIYIYIYMEHPFLMFLDHTQRRSTVGRTPLDE